MADDDGTIDRTALPQKISTSKQTHTYTNAIIIVITLI